EANSARKGSYESHWGDPRGNRTRPLHRLRDQGPGDFGTHRWETRRIAGGAGPGVSGPGDRARRASPRGGRGTPAKTMDGLGRVPRGTSVHRSVDALRPRTEAAQHGAQARPGSSERLGSRAGSPRGGDRGISPSIRYAAPARLEGHRRGTEDRKSTRLNSSHRTIS